jgi:hypothetical protein
MKKRNSSKRVSTEIGEWKWMPKIRRATVYQNERQEPPMQAEEEQQKELRLPTSKVKTREEEQEARQKINAPKATKVYATANSNKEFSHQKSAAQDFAVVCQPVPNTQPEMQSVSVIIIPSANPLPSLVTGLKKTLLDKAIHASFFHLQMKSVWQPFSNTVYKIKDKETTAQAETNMGL